MYELNSFLCQKIWVLFPKIITLGIFSQLEIYDGIFSVFTVMPSEIKIKNHSKQNVQNLGNEGQELCKKPQQESGVQNIHMRNSPKNVFPNLEIFVKGDSMLVSV